MAAADLLTTLHLVLQTGFLAVTLLLLLVTVVNRIRVRRVLLAWHRRVPLGPTAFLGGVGLFFGGAVAMGQAPPLFIAAGYVVGGLLWLAAGLLSSTVLITEYGIVQNANRANQGIAWGQVVDYFEGAKGRRQCFVFFYLDDTDTRRRFELTLPRSRHMAFGKIVRDRVDTRFERSAQQVYGKKALEG